MNQITLENFKIDKTNWKKVKLGDVVFEPKETVKDPIKEGIQHVVGLEHIDSEDIHLRRSASIDESTTFTKKFRKGDVLFGRRRAYLKKAAMAEFDGICSGDITVMRAKNGLLPELLPFIANNDIFFDYAVKHSAGGLSPRVKFNALSNYEFYLPPNNQQIEIADLLSALVTEIENKIIVLSKLNNLYSRFVDELFSDNSSIGKKVPLSRVMQINKHTLKSNTDANFTFNYLDIAGITEPKVVGELQLLNFKNAPSRARRVVTDRSIVLSLVRPYHKSFVFFEKASNIVASTGTAVLNEKNGNLASFVFHQFFSRKFLTFCETRMSGTNYPAITPNDLAEFEVLMPDRFEIQVEVATKLNSIDDSILEQKKQIESSKRLLKNLTKQIF